jgi:Protein of unknown function (DUF3383)
MAQLSIANVINVSVAEAQQGLGAYSPNNLAIFTNDVPGSTFGTEGFSIYLDPLSVATDFGTASLTYGMAASAFAQQPNMLNGQGYLAVIPFVPGEVAGSTSGVPATGSVAVVLGGSTVYLNATDTTLEIQAKLQTLPTWGQVQVTGSLTSSPVDILTYGVYGSPTAPTVGANTLETSGSGSVTVTFAVTGTGETLSAAIVRSSSLVQYFGILPTQLAETIGSAGVLAAAMTVQDLTKIMFLVTQTQAYATPGGLFDLVRQASDDQTRCLMYLSGTAATALEWASGYAGLGLSTNFQGSNTTQTMHLKGIVGTVADSAMTQTFLNQAVAAGVDTYPSIQGIPKTFTSGENGGFYDEVYNLLAFIGDLEVAGFNFLAELQTKVSQTEAGMTAFKGAYRQVCVQYVNNGYIAPGSWTSGTTFGNLQAFLQNTSNIGFYIFSPPVSQQSPAARAARQAPLVQIAIKEAGAVQSSDVIVYVNQ